MRTTDKRCGAPLIAGAAMLAAAIGCMVIATMTSLTRDELLITVGIGVGATFGFTVLALILGLDRSSQDQRSRRQTATGD